MAARRDNNVEILSFRRLKTKYKPEIISATKEPTTIEEVTYQSLVKIERILDNSFFPLFSFEPQKDVAEIIAVTSRRNKNKDAKRIEQMNDLNDKNLTKRTWFQCFESFNRCFAYVPNMYQKDTTFLKVDDTMMSSLRGMMQPPDNVSRVYTMPGFLACAANFKKLEHKKQITYGITLERLTSAPSIPMIDKPWIDYQSSFFQAMLLYQHVNSQIERQVLADYMMSWEGNTPSMVDYHLFIMSINPFFHVRMLKYYNDLSESFNNIAFFYDFIFIHRPFYCQERSTGFLSVRWLLPFDMSSVFGGSEIGNFSTIHQNNVTEQVTLVYKLNYDIKTPELFVVKRSSLYNVTSDFYNQQHPIENVVTKPMDTSADEDVVTEIPFSPAIDFDQKEIVFNIKTYDKLANMLNGITASTNALRDRRQVAAKLEQIRALSIAYKSKHVRQDIYKGRYFSTKLIPTDRTLAHDYNRRLLINEALHQWARDIFVIEMMKDSIKRIEDETSSLDSVSFVHEVFIKPAMLNEFDRIMLNDDYVFGEVIQSAPSQTRRTMVEVPITTDDVMYRYFLFINKMYALCLTNMVIDATYLQERTDIEMITKHIRTFPPSVLIKWMAIWLVAQNVPYDDGYNVKKSVHVFNRKVLPMMYQYRCLPIYKKHHNKPTCFSSNTVHDDEYLWSNTREYTSVEYHDLGQLIARQIELAKLLFFKTAYTLTSDNTTQAGRIDPKRYYTYSNRLFTENDSELIKSLLNINATILLTFVPDGASFADVCQDLSPIKGSDIIPIQNMIDFHMACINQYNAYMQYMIMRGNEFVVTTPVKPQRRIRAGAVYFTTTTNPDGEETETTRMIEFVNVLERPGDVKNYAPGWLYEYNPKMKELQLSLNDVKRSLNAYQRPNINQLAFFANIVINDYRREDNDRLIDVFPLVAIIIESLNDMIKNNQIVDFEYADEKCEIMNETLHNFVDIYIIDTPQTASSLLRKYVKRIENFEAFNLRTLESRKIKLRRWLFVERYITQQYHVVNEFYDVMDAVEQNSVGMDTDNIIVRLTHSLFDINNFINRELPISMNLHHEIIERNIALAAISRFDLRDYINQRLTIIELNNFIYLFKARTTGVRYGNMLASLPTINVSWNILLRDIRTHREVGFISETSIKIYPETDAIQDAAIYRVSLPIFSDEAIKFAEEHYTCFLFGSLNLYLVKPTLALDSVEEETDIVVYPPLSMPESSVTVFGNDILSIDETKVYQRINRFNNFMYIHQPNELHFLRAQITQELI